MRRVNGDEADILADAVKSVLYALERGLFPPFVPPNKTALTEEGLKAYLTEALRVGPSTDRTKRWQIAIALNGLKLSFMEQRVALAPLPNGAKYRLIDLIMLVFLAKQGWSLSLRNVDWETRADEAPIGPHRCHVYKDSIFVLRATTANEAEAA